MKTTSSILQRASLLSAALSLVSLTEAAELFSEHFDTEAGAHIGTNNGTGVIVTYVDYSSMTVGATAHSIAEAPRMIAGSMPARGVLLKVDYAAAATERIANLVALDDVGGSRLAFTDNYRLKFDVYLRLSPVVTIHNSGYPNESGTTEHVIWGIGYSATQPLSRGTRTARGGTGMWGWLTTEGGSGPANGSDASLCNAGTVVGARNMDNVTATADLAAFFTPAFGADASPVPHCPANQWVEADITVRAGQVTVEYKAVGAGRTKTKFYENVTGPVAGSVMVGYEDSFTSTSFAPDEQWMLLDNMVVEDITPPTLIVAGLAATPFTTFTGTPVTGTYKITNTRIAGNLTISAVNFTGTGAPAFTLATPMPLVVGPGATLPLNIIFNPAAPNGIKTTTITIVSDDPQTPNYVLSDVRVRRSAGSFFEAHYKLDEDAAAGTTLADSSGNGPAGALQVRDPVTFGQPSLLGATDTGKAVGFTPAQSSITGNYFTSSVVHTPTFSISLWMKPQAAGAIRQLWQRDYDSLSPYDKIYGLQLLADGTLAWRVRSTTIIPGTGDPPLPALADGEIHHVVLTHLDEDGFSNDTASRSRLYVNGLRVAEKTGADTRGFDDYPLNPVVSAMHVASRTIAGFGFSGDLDDFQVYGAELTREQVWELYKRPGGSASQDWRVLTAGRSGAPVTFGVTFPSSPEGSYRLYRSPDLQTWLPATDAGPGTADALTTSLADPAPPAGSQHYRVMRN